MNFVIKIAVNAVALWVAALADPGHPLRRGADKLGSKSRPSCWSRSSSASSTRSSSRSRSCSRCPFIILTLGLFTFIVNAFMLQLTEWLSHAIGLDFTIEHFFWDAVLGAIVITLVSMILNLILPDKD